MVNTQQLWNIRTYQNGDENKIFQLRQATRPERHYTREDWREWWNWAFQEIPSGSKIWLADFDGQIVAQFALLYFDLKCGESVVKASQSIEESTHPDYRRRGIMSKVQKHVLDEGTKTGIDVFYGFPSDLAYSKDIQLGYFEVATTRKIYRILNWENILKTTIKKKFLLNICTTVIPVINNFLWRASKLPTVTGLTTTRVSNFDERTDEFYARVSNRFGIMVARNKDYLNWRFAKVPGVIYSIYIAEDGGFVRGYIVFRCHYQGHTKVAIIYDLLAESEEISQYLLNTTEADCRKENAAYITWCGIADKAYLKAYQKRGFVHFPFKKGQKFLAYTNSPRIRKPFLMNSKNWFIQMGDSDEL